MNYLRSSLAGWSWLFLHIVGLWMWTGGELAAQQPSFRHFTTEDGLPTMEIYRMLQDRKGYIWFATAVGPLRFDGYKFEDLRLTKRGRVAVFGLQEDAQGRIWMLTSRNEFFIYENDSIRRYAHNEKIRKFFEHGVPFGFHVDANGAMHVGGNQSGLLILDAEGNRRSTPAIDTLNGSVLYQVEDALIGSKRAGTSRKFFLRTKRFNAEFMRFGATSKRQVSPAAGRFATQFQFLPDSSLLVVRGFRIMRVRSSEDLQVYDTREIMSYAYRDHRGRFWACPLNGGIVPLDIETGYTDTTRRYLDGVSVFQITQDREGGYWLATRGDGIFYAPNLDVLQLGTREGLTHPQIDVMTSDGAGTVYLGTGDARINVVRHGRLVEAFSVTEKRARQHNFNHLHYDERNGHLIISGMTARSAIDWHADDFSLWPLTSDFLQGIFGVYPATQGGYWLDNSRGVVHFDGERYAMVPGTEKYPRMRKIVREHPDGGLWLGTSRGLWQVRDGKTVKPGQNIPALGRAIRGLIQKGDTLIMAVYGTGLVEFDGKRITRQVGEAEGLPSAAVYSLAASNGRYWMSTAAGLSEIDLDAGKVVQTLTVEDGLLNATGLVESHRDTLYYATIRGLNVIPTAFTPESAPETAIHFTQLKVNGRDTTLGSGFTLPYYQNFLEFRFFADNFRQAGKVQYRYRLAGLEKEWNQTTATFLQFPRLASGSYKLQLSARNADGVWCAPAEMEFRIRPPFWQTWWFLVGGNALIILSIVIGWRYWTNLKKRRREQMMRWERKALEGELKALRSQMNPHFIFNSLTAIQQFMYTKDAVQAGDYLSRFARLMRQILENSREEFIHLDTEIGTIENYLELQKMRHDGKFDYTIEVDPALDPETTMLPPMLAQPFLENAIEHGFATIEAGGEIRLGFRQADGLLLLEVRDNGIGRARAQALKASRPSDHRSLATRITDERLQVLNHRYGQQVDFEIVDGTGDQGTVVRFRLPLRAPEGVHI